MRDLPFTAQNTNLAVLITIQRGLQTLRFTTHNEDLEVDGETYSAAPGATISEITFPGDASPATLDVTVMAVEGGLIKPGDGTHGGLDGWPINVELVDFNNLAAGVYDLIPSATISDVNEDSDGNIVLSVGGPLSRAVGPLTEHYSLTGREELGDDRCKIPILPADIGRGVAFVRPDVATGLLRVDDAYGRMKTGSAGTVEDYANLYYECTVAGTTDPDTAPAYPTTVGDTVVDGTATFVARDSWLRHARGVRTGNFTIELDALPDPRSTDATWLVLGHVYVRSGPLAGFPPIPISAWDPNTLTVTLALPIGENDIPVDTQLEIHVGCDLTPGMCFSRFNNIINIRAEPFVPPSTFGSF